MANTGSSYFKKDKGSIYLTASYCEFYIPVSYFDSASFAVESGNVIHTIGIFDVAFFENGKVVDKRVMKLPTWIDLFVQEVEVKKVRLPHNNEPTPCKVLKYNKGAKIMASAIVRDADNAISYMKLITKGKLPKSIPYDAMIDLWWKNQDMNKVSLGVPSMILEMILSVVCRDKKNPNIKFAKTIGTNPSTSQFDYSMASIRQITQLASTYTALTFEDFDSMVTASLNRSREKKPEAASPVEAVIKY